MICLPLGRVSTPWVLNHEAPKGVRIERGQNLFRKPEAPQLLRGVGKVNVVENHVPESETCQYPPVRVSYPAVSKARLIAQSTLPS